MKPKETPEQERYRRAAKYAAGAKKALTELERILKREMRGK